LSLLGFVSASVCASLRNDPFCISLTEILFLFFVPKMCMLLLLPLLVVHASPTMMEEAKNVGLSSERASDSDWCYSSFLESEDGFLGPSYPLPKLRNMACNRLPLTAQIAACDLCAIEDSPFWNSAEYQRPFTQYKDLEDCVGPKFVENFIRSLRIPKDVWDCRFRHYRPFHWSELPHDIQEAASVLGWDQNDFTGGDCFYPFVNAAN
jgi:hypothetical protein